MKRPGLVLLISCYELGHQPIGIASPFGFLERAGYTPDVMDVSVESLDTERASRAAFVGICVPMHTALRLGVHVAARVRKINPNCHICFYGLYASLNAEYLLEQYGDSVIGGEYEKSLVELIDSLAQGTHIDIEGVVQRTHSNVRDETHGAKPFLKRLPFAVPRRDTLPPLEKYAHLEQDGVVRLAGYTEATRGCKHFCLHCPIPPVYGGRFFAVPKEVVLKDIQNQVEAGASHITFGDPDFLNGPKHAVRIVQAMHETFPDLTFDCTVKIEHILKQRSILPDLRARGCIFMVSAVESLNDTVLTNLEKGHTRTDVFVAIDVLREAGISLRPSLVPFTPWETLSSYVYLLNSIEERGLIDHIDPVQYTIRLLIPPGSSLLFHSSIQSYLGSLNQQSFTYHWTHPDPRMDDLHKTVSTAVERACQIGEDAFLTFHQVQDLANAANGHPQPPISCMLNFQSARKRPPRLTEDWFC